MQQLVAMGTQDAVNRRATYDRTASIFKHLVHFPSWFNGPTRLGLETHAPLDYRRLPRLTNRFADRLDVRALSLLKLL